MTTPHRNDPCPCGSGLKYKRCCLRREAVRPATRIENVDGVVTRRVLTWLAEEHAAETDAVRALLPAALWTAEEHALLLMQLVAWETPDAGGRPLCLRIPSRITNAFSAVERDWLEAQRTSWFSIWDVLEVRRDEGLFLRDLLTGEERFVREARATHYVTDRLLLLARTARLEGSWVLCGSHGFTLPPVHADAVERAARRALKLGRGKVRPAALRGEAAFLLASIWDEGAEIARQRVVPELRTFDGDPVLMVEDRYRFEPASVEALRAELLALPGAGADDEDGAISVTLPVPDGTEVCAAMLRLVPPHLTVETHSLRRADGIRAQLEALPVGLVHENRETTDPRAAFEASGEEGPSAAAAEAPPEAAGLVRAFKEQHYASWLDMAIPALGGLTPREAARDRRRKAFQQLEVQLRDLERMEAALPEGQRYDVGILRRALEMP